jgi:hypothetical protein
MAFFVVVCFPLWLLLSAANLLKLPESQKLQDSYTNTDTKQTQKETQTERHRERERERCVILGRG